ncbi:DMSO reductase [Halorubrum sp. CBA1125]|jgi:complex iron-sulfur molybdoenzyme family reductase subunit gamma|uniref:ethylbenzene dehydrogenase-related protein n=1 Tax=Halorubrum sp. CBA1125 TaxID=2668072 RepID=UPI0012E9863D|nr:ethylbenzene dehydrogenase-related protein [Halorubrum sp. CBA1125]MUW14430.1 DMSO reductase [Halorubrum sp. CBA1125]
MKRNELLLVAVLAAVVIGATAVLPPGVGAQSERGIPVEYTATADDLDSVTGNGWEEVQSVTVPLSSAGADVPSADDVTIEQMRAQAVRTDSRLYLRISWADPTRDTSEASVREFADGAAVQLPTDGDQQPPIAMGSRESPVNVWYWSGSGETEELFAGGPGTTTQFQQTTVATEHTYADGRWQVLFTRQLAPDEPNRTTVPSAADEETSVAFAVWNGSNMEVAGQKSASQWHRVAIGPAPPAYERVLWAVAGVAIVITTLVTIQGIRHTGGDGS